MSMVRRARMGMMPIGRKKHCKPMIGQRRMSRTEVILQPVMSMGMRARMATMRMRRE
jgi:hypothetical protein